MSAQDTFTLCGAKRQWSTTSGTAHYRTPQHLEAMRKWEEDHSPLARQAMTRHDFHVWLRIGCGQLGVQAAA